MTLYLSSAVKSFVRLVWLAFVIASVSFTLTSKGASISNQPALTADNALVRSIVTAEETSLVLTRKLNVLAEGLLDLRLPGPSTAAAAVFAPLVATVDIGPLPVLSATNELLVESRPWPLSHSTNRTAQVDLWRPLLDAVAFFEYAKFSIIDGAHPDGDMWRYEAACAFEALAKMNPADGVPSTQTSS